MHRWQFGLYDHKQTSVIRTFDSGTIISWHTFHFRPYYRPRVSHALQHWTISPHPGLLQELSFTTINTSKQNFETQDVSGQPFFTTTAAIMQVKNTLVAAIFAAGVTALPQAEPTATCNRDNCYRQLIQKPELVDSFCATYTQTVNTASTALPTFVSNCQGLASRVSSACSCLHPATTTSVSTTAPPVTTTSATTSATPTTTIVPIVDGWVNYTTVGGYFLQDDESTNPTNFDYVRSLLC